MMARLMALENLVMQLFARLYLLERRIAALEQQLNQNYTTRN